MSPSLLLRVLLDLPMSKSILDYILALTVDVVDSGLTSPPPKRDPSTSFTALDSSFRHFVKLVICRAQVEVPMLLATAAYILRAKPVLCIARPEWAYERVFLGALIVASKYHNDSSLKNEDWSTVSGIFSPRDVSRVEREMLDVLAYELRIEESDILVHKSLLSVPAHWERSRRPRATKNDSIPADSESDDAEVSWSDSDSDSDTTFSDSHSSDDSGSSPVSHPSTRPLYSKRATYPGFPIPGALRLSLSS